MATSGRRSMLHDTGGETKPERSLIATPCENWRSDEKSPGGGPEPCLLTPGSRLLATGISSCVSHADFEHPNRDTFLSRHHNPDQVLEISTGRLWAPGPTGRQRLPGTHCWLFVARAVGSRWPVVDTPWEILTPPWTMDFRASHRRPAAPVGSLDMTACIMHRPKVPCVGVDP